MIKASEEGCENMDYSFNSGVSPFIKWLGGKRWLTPVLERELDGIKVRRYIEPFLGGAATYFHFRFRPAMLSDINKDLINTYVQVRDNVTEVLRRLKPIIIDSNHYYEMRDSNPGDGIDRAVRFLYLNRTAFGGIYRVNADGRFNVPFGNYARGTEILWRESLLVKASEALQGTNILSADFEEPLKKAGRGDLIYCDPTYTTMHNNNGFRKYNEKSFSWSDQIRLSEACHKASSRGAMVIVSNACHEEIAELYCGFDTLTMKRNSVLCPQPSKRKPIEESLFVSIPK